MSCSTEIFIMCHVVSSSAFFFSFFFFLFKSANDKDDLFFGGLMRRTQRNEFPEDDASTAVLFNTTLTTPRYSTVVDQPSRPFVRQRMWEINHFLTEQNIIELVKWILPLKVNKTGVVLSCMSSH